MSHEVAPAELYEVEHGRDLGYQSVRILTHDALCLNTIESLKIMRKLLEVYQGPNVKPLKVIRIRHHRKAWGGW